jgi:4-alpha-glucanotransferase
LPARTAGLLLHPTSLPGPFGIGDLGRGAFEFVEFLAGARLGLWQVLPLGPTGYGDSPYQCFSTFAGNPRLIALDVLCEEGLLTRRELRRPPAFPPGEVDFAAATAYRMPLLGKAFDRFEADAGAAQHREFESFCDRERAWLDDYALFEAIKKENEGSAWSEWPGGLAEREPSALATARDRLAAPIRARQFWQWRFSRQWAALRAACHARQIRLMGDIPIFVAHDSADVWSHPELFFLAADGRPTLVAGVPPDYFSATGQRWGNPLYRWDVIARTGFAFWIERLRAALGLVDLIRLDHFRGFEAYWEVPAADATAMNGRWVKGPGPALLDALKDSLGELPIVAENLGLITPEVEALRDRYGLPGMAILQFAFTSEEPSTFQPHRFERNLAVYTGTHDNDTIAGWWNAGVGDSTRTPAEVAAEKARVRLYLGSECREIHWDFIRAALASVADIAIVPVQDLLGLGSEARMNLPGRPAGNWKWRLTSGQLTPALALRLGELALIYERAPRAPA